MDISVVIAIFTAILVASAVLLYIGTVGLKVDKNKDQIQR
jgi:predicted permease